MFTVEEYVGAGGYRLRYGKLVNRDCHQTGRTLLFVPGLGGSVKGALPFLEKLLPVFSPIYGPDLRGFGLNPLEKPIHSSKILLEDLEAFHQAVGLEQPKQPVLLAGLSLGGVLATLLATQNPERYERLLLMAPAFRAHGKSFSLQYQIKNALRRFILGREAYTRLPYNVDALTTNPDILNDPQYRNPPPLDLSFDFLWSLRTLCNQSLQATKEIQIPTMMVVPGQDVVCDPEAMRQGYEQIPASTPKTYRFYPELYHDILFENAHSEIAEAVCQWATTPLTPPLHPGAV